jgi:hypothetical protein
MGVLLVLIALAALFCGGLIHVLSFANTTDSEHDENFYGSVSRAGEDL